ncbi:ABC transporter substrate-binding protein [Rhodovarius sp.]|uniref:ABC transporter substrate-binding protein n=1 Tax=Rhodovarius sp. TaxID=2972673 RepID=UPI00333EB2F8
MNRRETFLLVGSSLVSVPAIAQETPRRGGVMTVHFSTEQRILNPSLQASTGVYIVGGKIQEALVDLDAAGNPTPVLAESWESSADGKSITFKLRAGVTWHDGKPFTSADVAFTAMEMWKKILNYGTALQLFLTAVDTPDPLTAIFRYERPMPLGLLLRALPDLGYISPKHIYETGDIRQNPANTAPIGTGPFKFVQYERGQFIIADRNTNYWRPNLPYLDRVVWRVVGDRAAAAAQMEAGQILFSPYSALAISDFQRLARDPRFEVTTRGNEGNARTNTLEFNFRNPILADIRVRKALAHALNIPFFIENFLGSFAKPGTGPIPSVSTDYYPAGMPQYPFDVAAANRLLDEAGHRRGAGGVRFSLRLHPAPWGEDISLFATFMQQSFAQIGVRIEIVRLDAAGWLRTIYNDHNFDLASGWHQYRSDPAVSTTVWYRSGSPVGAPWTNQWGWNDPTIDQIIDNAATELDVPRRRALYADFVRRAQTELPLWMPIEQIFVSVFNKRLRNVANNPRWASSSWHDTWLAN